MAHTVIEQGMQHPRPLYAPKNAAKSPRFHSLQGLCLAMARCDLTLTMRVRHWA